MAHEPGTVFAPLVQLPKDLNQCWLWLAQVNEKGAGLKQWNGRPKTARKWIWELLFGNVPKGLVVYGTCGTPECFNPSHMACGTRTDVNRNNTQAILTLGDIQAIRDLANNGVLNVTIAERFGVDPSTISDIIRGARWKRNRK